MSPVQHLRNQQGNLEINTSTMEIVIADKTHKIYAEIICETITESANVRGTGIAKRTPEYIATKMENGNAVIALDGETFAGFCYIEKWGHGKFVANSGLIVHPNYRGKGLAKQIKHKVFEHSRNKFPDAKVFSITTGLAVMKLNSDLGYKPVTFSELTDDQTFLGWLSNLQELRCFNKDRAEKCVYVPVCLYDR